MYKKIYVSFVFVCAIFFCALFALQAPWADAATGSLPIAVTVTPVDVTATTAKIIGSVVSNSGPVIHRGFYFGRTLGYGRTVYTDREPGNSLFDATVRDLSCNTIYHYRVYGTNVVGLGVGDDVSFTTLPCPAPSRFPNLERTAELRITPSVTSSSIQERINNTASSSPASTVTTRPATAATTIAARYIFARSLAIGATGKDVLALQKFLVEKGYLDASAATGYYGPLTARAVRALQTANKLEAVGTIGPKTLRLLNGN